MNPRSEYDPPTGVQPELSIVSTMYRSRAFLPRFIELCQQAARDLGCRDVEIVLVNDGSPDESLAYAFSRLADVEGLVVVDLSRNFGHHHAIQAGLAQARGHRVFLIDCDLEVDPSVLLELGAAQQASSADMVYGYQEARKGGWFERVSGGLFWRALNAMSDVPIPANMLTERLMTRRYVDALLRLGDRNLFMGGMMSWVGYRQLGIPLRKRAREGPSTYTLVRRFQLMVNAVSSFSSRPLVWMFHVGWVITMLSFAYVLYLVARKLAFGDALLGFTSMMALNAMSLGILTTAVGVIGIYLGKVFTQVQGRPSYLVKEIHYGYQHRPDGHEPLPFAVRTGQHGVPLDR
jgi:putative glycosyltransferase